MLISHIPWWSTTLTGIQYKKVCFKYTSPHSPCKITSPYKHWDIINPLHVEVKWPLVEIGVWKKFYMLIKEMHVLVMTSQFNWRNRVDPECKPATFSHVREDLSLKSWQLCQNSLVAVKKGNRRAFKCYMYFLR